MRPEPDASVRHWLNRQAETEVYTTAITIFEIQTGIELLAHSRRRQNLEQALAATMAEIGDRVLPFDATAAKSAAELVGHRQRLGRPVEFRDMQIAGIVRAHRAQLATFNRRHFADLGIDLLEPAAR